jgi:hypothetical protein
MDHREFDNYLTLLSSLLQIRGEQREAIARELKAHLEDRLDDLLARGVDHDEAVQQALAEFGDAAGLAANFSLLVRNRRRRWFVKVTSYSTAALVLLAVTLIALWPEHRPGPAPARVIAQDPNVPAARPGGPASNSKPAAEAARGLDDKLAMRLTAEFVETPLKDVLSFLSDNADVQMFVNRRALEEDGLTSDSPVTMNLRNVRLDMLLDLILEQVGSGSLTYVERDNILLISTVSNLEGAGEVRVYNCRDLLEMDGARNEKAPKGAPAFPGMPGGAPGPVPAGPGGGPGLPPGAGAAMGGGGGFVGGMGGGGLGGGGLGGGDQVPLTEAERRAESLKNLIRTAVKPGSWSEEGGLGTISEYNGLIVINHNSKVHQKVEDVLKMLREAAGLEQGKTAKVARP